MTGVAVGMILIQIAMNKTKREEEEEKKIHKKTPSILVKEVQRRGKSRPAEQTMFFFHMDFSR